MSRKTKPRSMVQKRQVETKARKRVSFGELADWLTVAILMGLGGYLLGSGVYRFGGLLMGIAVVWAFGAYFQPGKIIIDRVFRRPR